MLHEFFELRVGPGTTNIAALRPKIVAATDGVIDDLVVVGDYRLMNKASHPWMTTNYIGYTGYAQHVRASSPVEVCAILRGSPATACSIATVELGVTDVSGADRGSGTTSNR